MAKRAAVFSCLGIGDGLIALVLSNNLNQSGLEVTTFHPTLSALQEWFPHLPIRPFPSPEVLDGFDEVYIMYEKTPQMQAIIAASSPERTKILNPIATKNHDYPYWEVGRFEGDRTFVDNIVTFCQKQLKMPMPTKSCGIIPPQGVTPRKYPRRIVIHPMSSRPGKNWLKKRFEKVARILNEEGYEPVFVMSPDERDEWKAWKPPTFKSLNDLAAFVCESGGMIGNDSGIGHLASALGLPTVTLCRTKQIATFWRPSWSEGVVLFPPAIVPNLKGMRLRDKYWKELISTRRVLNSFKSLLKLVS